ncbi:hypothetical protein EVAR_5292_1 [Eumeta japonica]|uniref:ATP-dependent DNA helicase n=1 Tax=Eumeta variegata TaxID=151549 RepID=A0A4C1TM46_EUMVA|nr:hypothetical protein EVAR_5292_1 [Eumeta japonica]
MTFRDACEVRGLLENDSQWDITLKEAAQCKSAPKQITEALPLLNSEQKIIFDTIIQEVAHNQGGLFILDAPGGTGKTYLLNLLLSQIRKNKGVAVAVASFGIADTLLSGEKTAQLVLKLPLNLAHEKCQYVTLAKAVNAEECYSSVSCWFGMNVPCPTKEQSKF